MNDLIQAINANLTDPENLEEALESLRTQVLAMGGLVERLLEKALNGLLEANSALAQAAIDGDDKVNDQEIAIDQECTRILGEHHPEKNDLRLVMAIVKIIADIERIGDESEKIGHIGIRTTTEGGMQERYKRQVRNLGFNVKNNLRDSLNAFARMDAEASLRVAQADKEIDEEYEGILREMLTYMMEDTRNIRGCMDIIWVVRALERIGDHAKNIAEHVIYLVQGHDIRHMIRQEHEDVASLISELDE